MRLELIHIGDIVLCPPVVNLINMLEDLGIETEIITTNTGYDLDRFTHISAVVLPFDYEADRDLKKKLINMIRMRRLIWDVLDRHDDADTVIWITSNIDLKHLGKRILTRKYILQLMELSEHLRYHNRLPFGLDPHEIGEHAAAVVVPEYNRAHIIKAWWDLGKTPLVLSNKPYIKESFKKNSEIHDGKAREIIESLDGKKIILYQGIIHKERPLDKFIQAVDALGNDYAFVVMSGGENIYKDIQSRNYYFIPFVRTPMHLEITSHAYIGILSYFPTRSSVYSILNAVFCAPNKTFEYAMFGVPMLGNDNPGLNSIFYKYNCGLCIRDYDVDQIVSSIKKIEEEYETMSRGAKEYYESTDTVSELKQILETI